MKIVSILLLILMTIGCTPKTEDAAPKTGVESIAVGSPKFGNVFFGEYREAVIRFTNYGPDIITNFDPNTQLVAPFGTIISPFSVSSLTSACNSGSIPVNVTCELKVKFAPTTSGTFTRTISIGNSSQEISGKGVDPTAVIDFSTNNFNIGTVIAGETVSVDLTLTNQGNTVVVTPVPVGMPTGGSITRNDCGDSMAAKKVCIIRFSFYKTVVGTASESFIMRSRSISDQTITITSNTKAGPPAGTIAFLNPPTSIIADSVDYKFIQTAPIRDQFNNVIDDGYSFTVLPYNLSIIQNDITKPYNFTSSGGQISFYVKSTSQKGDSTITLVGGATGFLRFQALSGPPVGVINAEPFINTVNANGITQIDVKLLPLTDQFGNIVEDGTPVYFSLSDGGTLLSGTLNTILGTVRQTITPPTIVGSSILTIKAGSIDSNSVCGYSACGNYTLNFVPSDPSGNIAISPVSAGIFADPALGISLGETIQTVVNVGPVKDQYGNIVASGTALNLNLENGVNVFNTNLTTDSSGMANFTLAGTGNRGPINITVSKLGASGTGTVWAYKATTLRADSPGLPTSPYKLFMTYFSDSSLPAVEGNWGIIPNWGNLDIQDNNFFGDKKKASPPTLIVRSSPGDADHPTTRLPYFTQPCLFSAGVNTYAGACYVDNFNGNNSSSVQYVIQKNAVDNGTGMIPTALSNLNNLSLHQERPEGCYKYDNQVGSTTYGFFMIMRNVPQQYCGVVDANYNPNGDGTWYGSGGNTPIPYYLKYPTRGYIADLDKLLIFGGYYVKPEIDFFGSSLTAIRSNRSSWLLNKGAGTAFNELESDNADGHLGDYPESMALAQTAVSTRNLYMFGGLKIQNTSIGSVSDYSLSTPSDNFYAYLGNSSQWQSLSPAGDNTITDPNQSSTPTPRYQHGMVYIPESNSLFLGSGKTRVFNSTNNQFVWVNANDLWSVNLNSLNSLTWKRECFPCNFPANAHFHPTSFTSETQLAPTDLRMTWNPFIQKVMMLWEGTSNQMSFFNPFQSGTKTITNDSYTFNSGATNIVDNKLEQIEFNPNIGRTYFYKRKAQGPASPNSDVWYWDMDPGNKQYYRIQIDLGGAGVKNFIRDLSVNIRGYGKVTDLSSVLIGGGGLTAKIYNYTTNSWEALATNLANSSFDSNPNYLNNTYSASVSKNYVSPEGKLNILVYPNGSSSGSTFNELFLDEVYISGTF